MMEGKPVLVNENSKQPSGDLSPVVCGHNHMHYSLEAKSVICEVCGRAWRDEWGPITLQPQIQLQIQLPPDIEMYIRMLQSKVGANGLHLIS
jgi:hypothetical protein